MNRILIVYYSFSGTTRNLALNIAKYTGGDIRELVPQNEYSFDYNTASKEARNEIIRGYCPKILLGNEPANSYESIFVGTPNWFKSLAPPVLSFLRTQNLSGKTIIPFCTHGGGGFGEIIRRITEECPNSTILSGFSVNGIATTVQITDWLREISFLNC